MASPAVPAALLLLALAAGAAAAGLAAQRLAATRMAGTRHEVHGSGPALLVAGAQLFDGTVSWLAVRDPLGVLGGGFEERVALSAWLLEHTGPGFIAVKWALALAVVAIIDGRGWPTRAEPRWRFVAYALMALAGLWPAVFSSSRLLGVDLAPWY